MRSLFTQFTLLAAAVSCNGSSQPSTPSPGATTPSSPPNPSPPVATPAPTPPAKTGAAPQGTTGATPPKKASCNEFVVDLFAVTLNGISAKKTAAELREALPCLVPYQSKYGPPTESFKPEGEDNLTINLDEHSIIVDDGYGGRVVPPIVGMTSEEAFRVVGAPRYVQYSTLGPTLLQSMSEHGNVCIELVHSRQGISSIVTNASPCEPIYRRDSKGALIYYDGRLMKCAPFKMELARTSYCEGLSTAQKAKYKKVFDDLEALDPGTMDAAAIQRTEATCTQSMKDLISVGNAKCKW